MEKISGLLLDVYDDTDLSVLRAVFPAGVPDLVKTGHALSPEERAELPDDVFALILHDEGVTLRKYACTDAGNTALAVEYFLKTAHKLPLEAQKVAASNLVTSCGWYDIPPPAELTKIAFGAAIMGAAGKAMTGLQVAGAAGEVNQNLKNSKALGTAIGTPAQIRGV